MKGHEYWVITQRPEVAHPSEFRVHALAVVVPPESPPRIEELFELLDIPPQPIDPPGASSKPPATGSLYCRAPVDVSPRLCSSPKGTDDPKRLVSLFFAVTANSGSQRAPTWYWKPGAGPYLFGDPNEARSGDELSLNLDRNEYSVVDPWMCAGPSCELAPAPP
jgi:hypothetical protein